MKSRDSKLSSKKKSQFLRIELEETSDAPVDFEKNLDTKLRNTELHKKENSKLSVGEQRSRLKI